MAETEQFKRVPGEEIAVATLSIDDGFNDDELEPITEGQHLLFFGCCCDFRTATMIINGIALGIQTIILLFTIIGFSMLSSANDSFSNEMKDQFDDDAAIESLSDINSGGLIGTAAAFVEIVEIFTIAHTAIGFYGAYKFKNWALITKAVFVSIKLLSDLYHLRIWFSMFILPFLLDALWLYPHVMMIHLVRKRIMTPSNYRKNCCAC